MNDHDLVFCVDGSGGANKKGGLFMAMQKAVDEDDEEEGNDDETHWLLRILRSTSCDL